jgi:hypothetical protein
MVTKTPEELDEMRLMIQMGKLPPDAIKQHLEAEKVNVFGAGFRTVNGVPQEQGIGSPAQPSLNSLVAIRKYEGEDAYQRAVDAIVKRDPDSAERLGLKKRGTR